MTNIGDPPWSSARIQGVLSERGIDATRDEIDAALSGIDQQAIKDEEAAEYDYELWDKSSPINGVSADEMLARDGVREDKPIYLITDAQTGGVQYFQYVIPHASGYLPEGNWESFAQDQINDLANRAAFNRVVENVVSNL